MLISGSIFTNLLTTLSQVFSVQGGVSLSGHSLVLGLLFCCFLEVLGRFANHWNENNWANSHLKGHLVKQYSISVLSLFWKQFFVVNETLENDRYVRVFVNFVRCAEPKGQWLPAQRCQSNTQNRNYTKRIFLVISVFCVSSQKIRLFLGRKNKVEDEVKFA